MRQWIVLAVLLAAGCASTPEQAPVSEGQPAAPRAPAAPAAADCRAEVARLQARLATEVAERQRLLKAASRREDALKRQLDALKSIERGILDREDRTRP